MVFAASNETMMPIDVTCRRSQHLPLWPNSGDLDAAALLFDIDGTLLDIAPTPSGVSVPPSLRDCLHELHGRTDGALALVSGRQIGNIDHLFAPLRLPAIGGHGAEMRVAGNQPHTRCGDSIGEAVRAEVNGMLVDKLGIITEDKGSSLAIHYRLAPTSGPELKAEIAKILDRHAAARLEALYGKAVIEIKPRSFDKGTAVVELMKIAPFANRRPFFVGDDTTDQAVFAVLPMLGGRGFSVERRLDGANGVFASPCEVRFWLERLCGRVEVNSP